MSKKMLLALAAVSAAMFALPAMASAGTWNIHNAAGQGPEVSPLTFTFASPAGSVSRLTSGTNVSCTGFKGEGKYNTKTTGEITKLEFTGCKPEVAFGETCSSAGAPAGTIRTITPHVFHNIKLEPGQAEPIGILITPKELTAGKTEGQFATFTCKAFGISLPVNVEGNGIIGQITSPKCGVTSNTATLVFEGTGSTQKWRQITTSGVFYELTSSVNNGAFEPAAQDSHATITFNQQATAQC